MVKVTRYEGSVRYEWKLPRQIVVDFVEENELRLIFAVELMSF
jgi:hypothetical protein